MGAIDLTNTNNLFEVFKCPHYNDSLLSIAACQKRRQMQKFPGTHSRSSEVPFVTCKKCDYSEKVDSKEVELFYIDHLTGKMFSEENKPVIELVVDNSEKKEKSITTKAVKRKSVKKIIIKEEEQALIQVIEEKQSPEIITEKEPVVTIDTIYKKTDKEMLEEKLIEDLKNKTYTCSACGSTKAYNEMGGKQPTPSNPLGTRAMCKACINKRARDRSAKMTKILANANSNESSVSLDFSGHKNLLIDIKERAKENFRTPEGQIMYELLLITKGG